MKNKLSLFIRKALEIFALSAVVAGIGALIPFFETNQEYWWTAIVLAVLKAVHSMIKESGAYNPVLGRAKKVFGRK